MILFFKQNESIIEDIIRKATHREQIFKLRAKADQYNVKEFYFYKKINSIILI
jgi:hypothetical protein